MADFYFEVCERKMSYRLMSVSGQVGSPVQRASVVLNTKGPGAGETL